MTIHSVGPAPSTQPITPQNDEPRTRHASNAQSDAMLRNVVGQFAQSALQGAAANPEDALRSAMQSVGAEAPRLLLGLIPIAGPFILLGQLFVKVAGFAGTAQPKPQQHPNAPVIPNRAPPAQPGMKSPEATKEKDGEARASWKETASVEHTEEGRFGDARNGGSGSLTARADAGVRADAVAQTTATGARLAAGARAEAGAAVNARGELHGDLGSVAGEANAYGRVYAEGRGVAEADITRGVSATATASAGAEAGADARVCMQTAPIVQLGDYPVTANASANGYAVSGTGATCQATATATYNPAEVVAEAGARAFAGARAGTSATIGAGPFKLDVGIDARAGAGAEVGGFLKFKDGKLECQGFGGIAAAVGLGMNFNLTIDFNDLGALVAGIFGAVATSSPPGSPGQTAAQGISDFVKLATPFAAKAAEKYSKHDLLNGQGGFKEEVSGQTRRDDPALESRSQQERDAVTEADLKRQRAKLDEDQQRLGSGARSQLKRPTV
ncbi:MAG: hypothetical protein JNJ54_25375 [Myxococcaceae bacterium]|nr:hypothetical protein [Myxococcaceae bacterium]